MPDSYEEINKLEQQCTCPMGLRESIDINRVGAVATIKNIDSRIEEIKQRIDEIESDRALKVAETGDPQLLAKL